MHRPYQFCVSAILGVALVALPTPTAAQQTTDHLLFISVDGLHAGHLFSLLANDLVGDFASFQRFVDEGAVTFNARTDFTHTNTAPNHTCMLTGRPVLRPFEEPETAHHGYTFNSDPDPADTYHDSGNPSLSYVASVFDVAHDHGLRTACYVSKAKLLIVDQSYGPTTGALDLIPPDDGRDKIDQHVLQTNLVSLNAAIVADLAAQPAHFAFIHYNAPDIAGHADGWGSAAWNDAVREVDVRLAEVFLAIESNPILVDRTAVILTADHGGFGTSHGDTSNPEVYTIPFFVWGPGAAAGMELYAMNLATRQDPGSRQLRYHPGLPPIRDGDAGNLALQLLDLPPIPGSMINAQQDLKIDGLPTAAPGQLERRARLSVSPNPFNPRGLLEFRLPRAGRARLEIFDAAGRRVMTIADRWYPAGSHTLSLDASELASGSYFALLSSRGQLSRQKLTLLK